MGKLPPWAQGPFELIVHAEEHLQNGEDFDRRIALERIPSSFTGDLSGGRNEASNNQARGCAHLTGLAIQQLGNRYNKFR